MALSCARGGFRRLCQAFLFFPLAPVLLHAQAHAATVGSSQTVDFTSKVLDLTCSIEPVATGALGVNTEKTVIGTEVADGSRSTFTVNPNFAGGQIVIDNVASTLGGAPYAATSPTVYVSNNGAGEVSSGGASVNYGIAEGENQIAVGLNFAPATGLNVFSAGEYDATLTLTCTTDGTK